MVVVEVEVVAVEVVLRIDCLDSLKDNMAFDVDIVVVVGYMDCYTVTFEMDTSQK